jgi:hypothetical protein
MRQDPETRERREARGTVAVTDAGDSDRVIVIVVVRGERQCNAMRAQADLPM